MENIVKNLYIYHENTFSIQEFATLEKLYQSKGLAVVFRGLSYAMIVRNSNKKTDDKQGSR
jgi:hypothetical protein